MRAELSQVKAVLFDLDGTLLDTYQLILDSMRYTIATELGLDCSDEQLMAKVGQPLAVQFTDFTNDPALIELLLKVYRAYNETRHDAVVRAFDGIPEVLAALKEAGFSLGVVTSKRHELAQRGLDITGLAPYMDFLVGPDDWPEFKPNPGSVLYGCRLAGQDPSECIYVGDSPFDIQAGNSAGCITIAALWGMFSEAVLCEQEPTYTCSRPTDILSLLV
ncbi:MAG: HAD-IA family hydrolase [Eggerthellaceae bacterium]|nr:HAD-IA family hydrolase [Eggerthellaceae bacterium]